MSELEKLLRDILGNAQVAADKSLRYPNPFTGVPSHLTAALQGVIERLKYAIGEVIEADLKAESETNGSSS